MSFSATIEKINSLLRFGIKPGLERITKLLSLMDNPQNSLKCIHVAGTNGKGSICTMLSSVLQQAGYKVGMFTSPYITDFRERFQINSQMISEKELTELTDYIYPLVKRLEKENCIITEFEFITALAFEWFKRQTCDIVVLEVGLGGRFDATNVIASPLISVITSISFDHTAILGDTLEKIAFEKAGIIKPNCPVVLYPQEDLSVIDVITQKANELNSPLTVIDKHSVKAVSENEVDNCVEFNGHRFTVPLLGDYQVYNTITALYALDILKRTLNISDTAITVGLKIAKIPARLEVLRETPLILLDGAHNSDAFSQLSLFITRHLPHKKVYMVIGILKDKAVTQMVSQVAPLCEKIFTVTPANDRALNSTELSKIVENYNKHVSAYATISDALTDAIALLDDKSCLVICGSLYLAGEVKSIFTKTYF